MGGYDNFKSQKSSTGWNTPSNLGFPINSTDDDKFFQPLNNGLNAYYAMATDYKEKDIFYLGLGGKNANKIFEIQGKYSLQDTTMAFDQNHSIHLIDRATGDTLDVGFPNKFTGLYSFLVFPGEFRLVYTGPGYISQAIDTAILSDNTTSGLRIDVSLTRERLITSDEVYGKINLSEIPAVSEVDSSILIRNLNVNDISDRNINETDILYYTVQVIALYNPVDVSYFKYINDIIVMYNDIDKFYRYTTGKFSTVDEARALKSELLRKGYPDDIFIKIVSK